MQDCILLQYRHATCGINNYNNDNNDTMQKVATISNPFRWIIGSRLSVQKQSLPNDPILQNVIPSFTTRTVIRIQYTVEFSTKTSKQHIDRTHETFGVINKKQAKDVQW